MLIGQARPKQWSVNRTAIALSSAKAELHTAMRAVFEPAGLKSFGRVVGKDLRADAWVDAQARIGLNSKSCFGKARHTETGELWIQYVLMRRTRTSKIRWWS